MKPIFVALSVLLASVTVCQATVQYPIPNSTEERAALATKLEQEWQKTNDGQSLTHLAIVYSAIAGLDDGSQETVRKAEKFLSEATGLFPKNYELMAAHGSTLTMLAQFETKTANQLKYVKKGARKMDRAAKKAPRNISVLLQRANNSLALPPFLNRTHYALRDFQAVLDIVGDKRGADFKAMLLYKLGQAYKIEEKPDMAKKYWQQVASLKNAPAWSAKAKESLEEL